MNALLQNIIERLIENPKPGAYTSGVATFGGYGIAKASEDINQVAQNSIDWIQVIGVASMIFGIVVGTFTLHASLVRSRADRQKRKYYEQKCKELNNEKD